MLCECISSATSIPVSSLSVRQLIMARILSPCLLSAPVKENVRISNTPKHCTAHLSHCVILSIRTCCWYIIEVAKYYGQGVTMRAVENICFRCVKPNARLIREAFDNGEDPGRVPLGGAYPGQMLIWVSHRTVHSILSKSCGSTRTSIDKWQRSQKAMDRVSIERQSQITFSVPSSQMPSSFALHSKRARIQTSCLLLECLVRWILHYKYLCLWVDEVLL
jgi:hypothetical protein